MVFELCFFFVKSSSSYVIESTIYCYEWMVYKMYLQITYELCSETYLA